MNTDQKLLSPAQTADFFGVHIKTLIRWRKVGIIDVVKIGGRVFFTPEEIDRVIRENRWHSKRPRTRYF